MEEQQLYTLEVEMVDEGFGDTIRLGTLLTLLAVPGIVDAKDVKASLPTKTTVTSEIVKQSYSNVSSKETYGGFSSIQAANIIAKTLFMEARGEGEKGVDAVASVIFNRGNSNPQNFPGVCLKRSQFVCWNDLKTRTPNDYVVKIPISVAKHPKDAEMWKYCQSVAGKMLNKTFKSTIGNRNAYHTTKSSPYWSSSMANKLTVGNHIFGYLPEYDGNRKNVSQSKEKTYIVKKDDTLSKIAVANNTTTKKLIELNPSLKKNPNKIVVGMKLLMPS